MIGWVHKMVNALALTSKVGLLNLHVQGELIEKGELLESQSPFQGNVSSVLLVQGR